MIFLLANILFASTFALCIKWVENRSRENIITVGMINYVIAATVSLFEFGQLDVQRLTWSGAISGGTMGVSYFIAFFFCIYAIKWIGVANATVVGILSILVPILFGVGLWNERPNVLQWVGIGLALISLSLIGRKGDATCRGTVPDRPWFSPWVIIGFFVLCGASRLAQESFRHTSDEYQRPVFLTAAFMVAAIPAVVVLLVQQKKITASEWMFGTAMGLANILQIHFILKSLKQYDGFIVFPLTSAGGLMFVTFVATRMMGERLGPLTYTGIAIACFSLALLNWTG